MSIADEGERGGMITAEDDPFWDMEPGGRKGDSGVDSLL